MYVKCHGKTVFKKIDSLHHHVCQSESKYKESKKKSLFYWLLLHSPFVGKPTNYAFRKSSTFKKKRYHTNP